MWERRLFSLLQFQVTRGVSSPWLTLFPLYLSLYHPVFLSLLLFIFVGISNFLYSFMRNDSHTPLTLSFQYSLCDSLKFIKNQQFWCFLNYFMRNVSNTLWHSISFQYSLYDWLKFVKDQQFWWVSLIINDSIS